MSSCVTSKSLYKKGNELAQAGMLKAAAGFYYNSLLRNSNNVDSRIALKSSAQKVLEQDLQEFYQAHGADQHKEAVYAYLSATGYKNKMAQFIELEIPPYYEGYYNESKGIYLEEKYIEAKQLIKEEKFEQANLILEEILRIDKNYKDAHKLEKTSDAEPLYRKAMANFDSKKYRTAYYQFEKILGISANYKDAGYHKEEALKKGRLTIAVLPMTGSGADRAAADALFTSIMQKTLALNNPFIAAIDRTNMGQIINEQKLGLSGVFDEGTTSETGKLLGAKAVLTGAVSGSGFVEKPFQKIEKRGYEKITIRNYDIIKDKYYKEYIYKKITYQQVSGSNTFSTNIQIQLVSSETGQVLLSKNVHPRVSDYLEFALYDGPYNNIYSGYWKNKLFPTTQDVIETSKSAKNTLDKRFKEKRRVLKSKSQLIKEMSESVAIEIANEINAFEQTRE